MKVEIGKQNKTDIQELLEALDEMFEGIAKRRRGEFLGHLNDISLFLEAIQREVPVAK